MREGKWNEQQWRDIRSQGRSGERCNTSRIWTDQTGDPSHSLASTSGSWNRGHRVRRAAHCSTSPALKDIRQLPTGGWNSHFPIRFPEVATHLEDRCIASSVFALADEICPFLRISPILHARCVQSSTHLQPVAYVGMTATSNRTRKPSRSPCPALWFNPLNYFVCFWQHPRRS